MRIFKWHSFETFSYPKNCVILISESVKMYFSLRENLIFEPKTKVLKSTNNFLVDHMFSFPVSTFSAVTLKIISKRKYTKSNLTVTL